MLPMSSDCPFRITGLVFSNIYCHGYSGNIAYLTLSNSQPTYIQCVVFFVHYGEEQVETEYMKRNLK